MMTRTNSRTAHKSHSLRWWFYALAAVAIIAALLGYLYTTNRLSFLRQTPKAYPTNNSYTKGEPSSPSQSSGSNPSPSSQDNKGSGTSSGPLLAPTGNFVSNHHPTLSNNPNGSGYLTSTCTTSPGATCQIIFVKDGITKSLPVETTDAGGSAYWNNWKLQDVGLTEGSWTVTAIAKHGTQVQMVNDALALEVKP